MTLQSRTRLLVDGGLFIGWGLLVWGLGGGAFSAPETSRILGPILDWLLPGLSPDERLFWMGAIRKLAHPFEYAVFAVLGLRFVHGLRPAVWRLGLKCGVVLAIATVLAALDESRQAGLASRTGSPWDVALDIAGAAVALVAVVALATRAGGELAGVPGWPRRADTPRSSASPPA